MEIKKIVYVLNSIGVGGIAQTIRNGFIRDIIDKRFSKKGISLDPIIPGYIQRLTPMFGGALLDFEHAGVELIFLAQNMIKISWTPGIPPVPYTIDRSYWDIQQPIIVTDEIGCSLICGNLIITIDRAGMICFQDSQQNILHRDNEPVRVGNSWHLTSILKSEEHIYGLGERAALLNLRPGTYISWNTDAKGSYSTSADPLYIGTPIYLSLSNSGSYLIYFENSFKSKYRIGENLEADFDGGMLRYYIIFGPLTTIYKQLSKLVGRPFLPPRWVLGYHQSHWGYRSEKEIQDVVKGFEEHDLPISAIHLDIDYMDGYRVFSINPKRYPNMKRMTSRLNKIGIRVVTTINPAIKQDRDYKVYSDGLSKDTFCKLPDGKILPGVSWPGKSVFPDFTNPKTREWWSEQYQFLLEAGISGFWHDMNEPSSFSAWGDMTLPNSTRHDMDGQNGDHLEVHNLYGLLMNKAAFEGIRKFAPDKRPWMFSRSGWASLQKYAWNWTGDLETSWKSLKQTIPTILGLGLSGHAFSGVDIGGFSGDPEAELYLRWFQMATFLPLYRTHSSIVTKPREPWVFGEPVTSIIRNFLKLRYKLLPYIYTLVWDTAQTGIPPVRPLFWDNPEDSTLWDINDEFLLGEAILIAPVVSLGAQTRLISLPAGVWYSYWNDQKYYGPTQFDYKLSPETIPIFIKGGTILPMEENSEINLHLYPNNMKFSSSHIYSDEGDGYGPWRMDYFRSNYGHNSLDIFWESEGSYIFPFSTIKFVMHSKKLIQATADNINIPVQENSIITPIFKNLSLRLE